MNLFIWVCVTQAIWSKSTLALYHLPSYEVFKPPESLRNDSYFGYSVTYVSYDQQNHTLVISAPRENTIGEVYECEMGKRNCVAIPKTIDRVYANYTEDYWFGASVKAGPDFVVMCAPRNLVQDDSNLEFTTFAKCFVRRKGRLDLMRSIPLQDRVNPKSDIFGWNIDVAFDGSIIMGSPCMYPGRAVIYKSHEDFPVSMRASSFNSYYSSIFNFGYAVSSGTFINDTLWYAVSSTYGNKGSGGVAFYKWQTSQHLLAKAVDTEVVGSMFGAVLCAAKLWGSRTDLLVGAPTYARGPACNVGAVYLYITLKEDELPTYKRTIVGQSDGSHFGSAIICLGDLNGDRKDEIAISAPFENEGRGAVYIYSGADLVSEKTEETLTWLQRIEPSTSVHSFGLSLTAILDDHNNGCKGLAIGAPYSDAVVVFRCMAAITVHTDASFPSLQNRTLLGLTDFKFKVCLSVEYPLMPNNITATISTTVEMIHSHAKLTTVDGSGTFKYDTSLHGKQPKYCKHVPFTVPFDGNYEMAIDYQISSTLKENPLNMKKFDETRVILSDRSILTKRDAVWAAECSGDKKCVPKVIMEKASFSFNDSYIIGSTKNETFNIVLSNSGDIAYDACVRVHILTGLVSGTPPACVREASTDGVRLLCAPTRPLRTDNTWNTGPIVLGMTHLTNQDKNIIFEILVYNQCKGSVTKNHTISRLMRGDPSGIFVIGATDVGDFVNMTKDEVYYDGKQIQHVYMIGNRGVTNWAGLTGLVVLELKPYIKYDLGTVYVSTSNSYSECSLHSNDTERMYFKCNIHSLTAQKQAVKIVVPMYIMPGILDNIQNQPEQFSSNFTLLFNGYKNISQSIFTSLKRFVVPWWVIFLAAIIGVFILIIMAYFLYNMDDITQGHLGWDARLHPCSAGALPYRPDTALLSRFTELHVACGFLRRKKRDELKILQQSVKRQSIMRLSTRMSQPPSEERKQILETTTEEHEDIVLPCPGTRHYNRQKQAVDLSPCL